MSSKLILASTSIYRKELLSKLSLDFTAHAPDFDEESVKNQGLTPENLASLLAKEKAQSLRGKFPQATIIGSDQVVALENQIFSKAVHRENAINSLKKLQGQRHKIITAICVLGPKGEILEHTDITYMQMRLLQDEEIERYVDLEQPLASAGSYKIEGLGISLFEKIESEDFNAIIGLPLIKLCRMLRSLGYQIP